MEIFKYHRPELKQNRIDFYYSRMDQETEDMIEILDSYNKAILGKNNQETKLLQPSDIYYCEMVDRKCYSYLKESVWQVDHSLQMMLDQYSQLGFVRISKSMVINVYKIDRLKSDINMRVNIILQNGETAVLNRTYRNQFYKYLEKLRKGME